MRCVTVTDQDHASAVTTGGVTVLDNDHAQIDGVTFFGTTLWSNFEGRSQACMNGVRRRCGEFFFVKKRTLDADGREVLKKFQPEDALKTFDASWSALQKHVAEANSKTVVISHHAPSLQGLNPQYTGNGMDGAFASDLDEAIAPLERVPVWVHGHTHIKRTYRIGDTVVRANCRGFDGKGATSSMFLPNVFFEL